jgi:succinylglutamic semialdehyde dehydrogenase
MTHYINGAWVGGTGERFESLNPATAEVIWEGHCATSEEIDLAITSAQNAFKSWSCLGYSQRHDILKRFKSLIEQKKNVLTEIISRETGKVLWDARSEVAAVLGKLGFTEAAYQQRTGDSVTHSPSQPTQRSRVQHRPYGVMAVFGPYNFPAHLPNGHIMPALLAGNVVVFKPSELTPLVAQWVVEQWHEAGIPAGVLQLVQGGRDTGVCLAAADIQGVLFTGSSATGLALHRQFAGRPEVLLALEMGGNNPLIVSEPGNIRAAVRETILSAYLSSGQRCTCARRLILVRGKESDAYLDALVEATRSVRVGSPVDNPEPFMGPLISMREMQRVISMQEKLVQCAGIPLVEARTLRPELSYLSTGLIDVTAVTDIPDEEVFGPLLQLTQVNSLDEAITVASRTRYGLSAGVLSADCAVFERVSAELRTGIINWNRQTTGASGAAPFGGVGLSGNHRPAGYYAADYCAYPVASMEEATLVLPEVIESGLTL